MESPLRVLHVVVNMNRGGAETLIMNIYRNIDRSKVQFDFLTCKEGVFDKEIIELGGRIHRIPYISDVGHFNYINALETFFSNHHYYQIVHSHMDKMSGFVLRSARKAGIPTRISHSHNTSSEGGSTTRLYKWFAGKLILPNATNLFACSNGAAKWLFNNKYQAAKVLKNGINSNQFLFSTEIRKQVRNELNLDEQCFVLGHVGRFNHQKNHVYLIEIFKQFTEMHNNSVLLLAGDGPLRTSIEKLAVDLGIDGKIRFLGIRSDIHRILQAIDVFVFPSLHEGLPVSLIEAQASGLPCIISDTITKEVDLNMGLIHYSSLSDKTAWVEKMTDIASNLSLRNSKSNSLLSKGYDISKTAENIEEFYLNVTG